MIAVCIVVCICYILIVYASLKYVKKRNKVTREIESKLSNKGVTSDGINKTSHKNDVSKTEQKRNDKRTVVSKSENVTSYVENESDTLLTDIGTGLLIGSSMLTEDHDSFDTSRYNYSDSSDYSSSSDFSSSCDYCDSGSCDCDCD